MCLEVLDACVCQHLSGSLLRGCVSWLQHETSRCYLPCRSTPAKFPSSAWAAEDSLVGFRSLGKTSIFLSGAPTVQERLKKTEILMSLQDFSSFANFAASCNLWSDKWELAAPPVCTNPGYYEEFRDWLKSQHFPNAGGATKAAVTSNEIGCRQRRVQEHNCSAIGCEVFPPQKSPAKCLDIPKKLSLVHLLERECAHIVMKLRNIDCGEVKFVQAWIPSCALPRKPPTNSKKALSGAESLESISFVQSAQVRIGAHAQLHQSRVITSQLASASPADIAAVKAKSKMKIA